MFHRTLTILKRRGLPIPKTTLLQRTFYIGTEKHIAKPASGEGLDPFREHWKFAPISSSQGKISAQLLCKESDVFIEKLVKGELRARRLKGSEVYWKKVSYWIKKENVNSVLDFGCGLGIDGVFYSKRLDVKVVFADIVKSNINLVSRYSHILNIPTSGVHIDSDASNFDFSETFDMIYANGVLHHIPNARSLVKNLRRFLKSNGLFIASFYTPARYRATGAKNLRQFAERSEAPAPIQNPFSDFYDLTKAKRLFEGFDFFDMWTAFHGHYGWYVFQKRNNR